MRQIGVAADPAAVAPGSADEDAFLGCMNGAGWCTQAYECRKPGAWGGAGRRGRPMPEAANLGIVRPPLVYLASIALGLGLHVLWPARLAPPAVGTPVGVVLTLGAAALFVSAVRTFRAAGTPVPGNRPTTTIVRSGPYRFSRNPIYCAFSLLQLGLAFWVDSLGLLITLIPAVALMSRVVIPREERYLEARFPSEYGPYRASVRRWL